MCEPVTAMTAASQIMLGISAASAVVSYIDGQQSAKAQEDAIRQGYANQQEMLTLQQQQINAASTTQMSDRAREALQEQARIAVIGGESGLAGISNDRMLNASEFAGGTDIARIEGNRARAIAQSEAEGRGMASSAQSKINSIKRPSLIGTGLQIAGGYAGQVAETERIRNLGKIGTSTRSIATR